MKNFRSKYMIKQCYLEITNSCNLNCRHCYKDSGKFSTEIPLQTIRYIIKQLYSRNCYSVILSGGEPLLHTEFFKIIKLFLENNFDITVITNGTLLTQSYISKFLNIDKSQKILFQISLDGSNKETNDLVRGSGIFNKVIEVAEMLNKTNYRFKFHSVINSINCTEIEDIIKLAIKLNAGSLDFGIIRLYGRAKANSFLTLNEMENYKCMKTLIHLAEKYRALIKINVTHEVGQCPLLNKGIVKISPRIDVNGNVYLCQLFNFPYSVGNIFYQSLYEVLMSNKIEELILNIKKFYKNNSLCQNCLAQPICGGGCPAYAMEDKCNGGTDGFCMYKKYLILHRIAKQKIDEVNDGYIQIKNY